MQQHYNAVSRDTANHVALSVLSLLKQAATLEKARQGVALPMIEDIRLVDRSTVCDVPRDRLTPGEIAIRGYTVMTGYCRDADGVNPDGCIHIRNRPEDVILSGGENIPLVEVQAVLYRHPAISAAAVVVCPHPQWGKRRRALVELRDGGRCDRCHRVSSRPCRPSQGGQTGGLWARTENRHRQDAKVGPAGHRLCVMGAWL